MVIIFLFIYSKITPHNEWQLIKNNNTGGVTGVQRYIVGLRDPLIQCGNQCGEYSRLFRLGRDRTGDSVTRFCWCQTLYARIKRKNY
ncbi:membrane protein YjfL [Escherichia coli]|uniref:Membrane protein YjfL n=1 Tax=Escherichia coli TaxID=562 RepID=A0A376MPB8_ECOLX|nr:membrane protein YjfL [Escherichia coli]